MTKSAPFVFGSAVALLAAALGCRDAAAPPAGGDAGTPRFVVFGPQPAIRGAGALGTGPATPGGDRQDFDFDVQQDLTGRVFYRDWRFNASITVDPADAQTGITAFRDQSAQCPGDDPTTGAELDGTGRREDLTLETFTLVACDLGPAESGADRLRLTTPAGYDQQAFLTSGDIVKTVVQPTGDLEVTTTTSGSSLPHEYTVTVDHDPSRPIGINAKETFTALTAGSHTVVLSDVPTNCAVTDGETRTVTVPSAQTATVAYFVSCVTPNTTPTVHAGNDEKLVLGVWYTLRWSFTDPDNGPWQYTINWGDGSSSSGTLSSAGSYAKSHNYLGIGSYTIRVTVTDGKGASNSDTKTLTLLLGGFF